MKKKLYPYKRIKNAIDAVTCGIGFSLLVGLIACFLALHYFPGQSGIGIGLLTGVFVCTNVIVYLICKAIVKREASKHKKRYIKLTVAQKNLTEVFEKNQPIKVNDKSFVYVYQERMFHTISIYYLDERTEFKDLKPLRREVTKFLKDNYPVARVEVNHKRHHELKVQLYVTDKFNKNILGQLTDGREQMYEIGFLRCYWCMDTQSLWVPFYKGEHMDFHAAKNYHNAYRKLVNLFDCIDCTEANCPKEKHD